MSSSLLILPKELRDIIYYRVFRTPMWEQHFETCKRRQGNAEQRRCCLMCFSMGSDRQFYFLQPCVIELQNNFFTFQRSIFWYDQVQYASMEGRYQRCSLPMVCRTLNDEACAYLYKHTPIFINIRRDTRPCKECGGLLGWNTVLEPARFTSLRAVPLSRKMKNLWITFDIKHDRNPERITSIIQELERTADRAKSHPDPALDPSVTSCSVCGRGWIEETPRYSSHRGQLHFVFKGQVEAVDERRRIVGALVDQLAEALKF